MARLSKKPLILFLHNMKIETNTFQDAEQYVEKISFLEKQKEHMSAEIRFLIGRINDEDVTEANKKIFTMQKEDCLGKIKYYNDQIEFYRKKMPLLGQEQPVAANLVENKSELEREEEIAA